MPHSSNSEPRKPLTVPPFSSNLPDSLLSKLSDQEREFYQAQNEMKQAIEWMAEVTAKTANRIEDVHEQAAKTNGRVTVIESDVREIRAEQAAVAKDVETVRAAKAVVKSRWFWVGAAILLFVVVPWIAAHVPPSKVWDVLVTLVSG